MGVWGERVEGRGLEEGGKGEKEGREGRGLGNIVGMEQKRESGKEREG
jgi:hypothetical protein